MLTAELKLNNEVIGTLEIHRTLYHGVDGLPDYCGRYTVRKPGSGEIIGADRCVSDHNPNSDHAWDLVRKVLNARS